MPTPSWHACLCEIIHLMPELVTTDSGAPGQAPDGLTESARYAVSRRTYPVFGMCCSARSVWAGTFSQVRARSATSRIALGYQSLAGKVG
jgi:hypothetical protein